MEFDLAFIDIYDYTEKTLKIDVSTNEIIHSDRKNDASGQKAEPLNLQIPNDN